MVPLLWPHLAPKSSEVATSIGLVLQEHGAGDLDASSTLGAALNANVVQWGTVRERQLRLPQATMAETALTPRGVADI